MFTRFDYFPSDDGLRIRWASAPAPSGAARGTVVLLNGRTEYLEKYGETAADLNQRGFAVISMDWRGQGLSDRLTANRLKGHVGRFGDYLDDLAHLVRLAQRHGASPLILMGHSMGAHIGIRYLRERRHPFARAVLTSPMIDIELPPVPRPLLVAYAKLAARLGFDRAFTPGGADYASRDRVFDDNPLTSDPVRFQRRLADLEADPRLALGGVTHGWLQAAFDSIDRLTRPGYARGLALPLLIVSATDERIVSREAQKRFCRQAPDCRFVDIPTARHEVLVETDAKRRLFWEAFDRFVTEGETLRTDGHPADASPDARQTPQN